MNNENNTDINQTNPTPTPPPEPSNNSFSDLQPLPVEPIKIDYKKIGIIGGVIVGVIVVIIIIGNLGSGAKRTLTCTTEKDGMKMTLVYKINDKGIVEMSRTAYANIKELNETVDDDNVEELIEKAKASCDEEEGCKVSSNYDKGKSLTVTVTYKGTDFFTSSINAHYKDLTADEIYEALKTTNSIAFDSCK